jgi:hypothetical protein
LQRPAFLELPFVVFLANLISTFAIGFYESGISESKSSISSVVIVFSSIKMVLAGFNVVILSGLGCGLGYFLDILALCLPGLAAQAPQSKLTQRIVCRVASMTYKSTKGQVLSH